MMMLFGNLFHELDKVSLAFLVSKDVHKVELVSAVKGATDTHEGYQVSGDIGDSHSVCVSPFVQELVKRFFNPETYKLGLHMIMLNTKALIV